MNKHPLRVFLSLGSNLGSRKTNLESALEHLSKEGLPALNTSSIYRTEPVDFLDQPEFLNLACEINCLETPEHLLKICQMIERGMGRIRKRNKGSRIIDIDIIYFGNQSIRQPELRIPHQRRLFRRFVLVPLREIAPDFVDPLEKKTIQELLEVCPDTSLVELIDRPLE